MRGPRPAIGLAAAVLAVVAVTLAAASVAPPTVGGSGGTQDVPIATAALVCPSPVEAADQTSTVSALTPPDVLPDLGPDGGGSIARLGALEDPVPLAAAGTVTRWSPPGDGQATPVLAEADGALAPGFAAQQSTRAADGLSRGRSGTACAASGTDFWFVGGGSDVGRVTTVYLTNVGEAPALVNVDVFGPAGPVEAPGGRGIPVLPGQQERVAVDALAPGVATLALHVTTSTGSVSAAVFDTAASGLEPLGNDWVPVSSAPSTEVLVPGLAPAPDGSRQLVMLAPGAEPALVRMQVIAPDGTFAPTGMDLVDVSPGEITTVDLSAVAPDVWASLRLASDQPIVAGLRQVRGAAGQAPEFAYLAGGSALTGPTSVVDGTRDASTATVLLLVAPLGGVRGSLVVTPDGEAPVTTPFEVTAGTTSMLPLAPDATSFTAVVVPERGSEPLYAARWVSELDARGPLVTAQPLRTPPITVEQPAVDQDLRTGLR
ncbi:MAG: DUF5719 family protein [Candidatus Nanopelagicales bacterium]